MENYDIKLKWYQLQLTSSISRWRHNGRGWIEDRRIGRDHSLPSSSGLRIIPSTDATPHLLISSRRSSPVFQFPTILIAASVLITHRSPAQVRLISHLLGFVKLISNARSLSASRRHLAIAV